jgi:hypothetical protein
MKGDFHVRFREKLRVKSPGFTRQLHPGIKTGKKRNLASFYGDFSQYKTETATVLGE